MPSITESASFFHPYPELARQLLPYSLRHQNDGSHDNAHLKRVWKNSCAIQAVEGGDLRILLAACLLHDCINLEKDSPLRAQASRLSAQQASSILQQLNWLEQDIARVSHAIEAHSFSANITPTSLEARILQDADRLDAIGALGIARCFYTAGRLGSQLYHSDDPTAQTRQLNDKRYALDHFPAKLLTLGERFQTEQGKILAQQRQVTMQEFLDRLLNEIH